jgi:hypothetical protein
MGLRVTPDAAVRHRDRDCRMGGSSLELCGLCRSIGDVVAVDGPKSATDAEKRRPSPRDEPLGSPRWQRTRAAMFDARPQEVRLRLALIGRLRYRADSYAPYRLDRAVWWSEERIGR